MYRTLLDRFLPTAPLLIALGGVAAAQEGAEDAHWPSWRGPDGTGSAPTASIPLTWSEEENVRWKLELPGRGSSTPVVWGDHLFLTTAVETDRIPEGGTPAAEAPAEEGGRRGRGRGRGTPPTNVHEFWVLAVDRGDGTITWKTKVTETVPHEGGHPTNTQASASAVTDGEHVLAFFGSRGLHCLDMEGELVWSKQFGRMQTRNQFGEGASPALHGDTVVIVWDHEGEDFIAALDKTTGEERWRVERDEPTTWDTPLIVQVGDTQQVIVTGTGASRGYDLESGEVIWSLGGMTTNCIPTPIHQDGRVWLMSGFRGAALQAVDLEGAKGNVALGEALAWSRNTNTSYVPSAVLHAGHLYFLRTNTGVLSCVNAGTGDVVYEGQRVGDIRSVYASPVVAGEHLLVTSREGLTVVIEAGSDYEEVAANQLDDTFDASAVVLDDALILRGWNSLYCIAEDGDSDSE